jgi:hypothetical protein
LFGYRLLWFFCLILLLKWALVFASARHMVLTGAHPFERWRELPGPAGWVPLVFLLLAILCFPIWVGFHSGTIGTLLSWLAGTDQALRQSAHWVWGLAVLGGVLVLVFAGSYATLEKVQLVIVGLMLLCVVIALLLLQPDWAEMFKGLFVPQAIDYPAWVSAYREIAERPVWVETTTYVGVLGGSGYDYLAYVSYLREKRWGQAGGPLATSAELARIAADALHPNRQWLRAPLIDCTLSFVAVIIFSVVFVACGAIVLGPQHKVPSGTDLLTLQSQFVSSVHVWLKPLYFVGAFLTMWGTLYGTIEVAPAVLREMAAALWPGGLNGAPQRLRRWAVTWVGGGGFVVLGWSLLSHWRQGTNSSPELVKILTPANLFTGVLACGLICLLNVWMDWRFLPRPLRMRWPLVTLNVAAGVIFLALGFKGYWDFGRGKAFYILAGTLALGWGVGWVARRVRRRRSQVA